MFLKKLNNVNLFENNAYDESNFRDCNEMIKFDGNMNLKGY